MTETKMNRPLFLIALTLLSIFLLSILFMPGFADFDKKISNYHIRNALRDANAPNVVSTIVWDYRAYDTLGEETILFTAALGIYALFQKYRKRIRKKAIKIFDFPKKVTKK
ncbi:MAG: hypothetical protein KAT37_00295 [Candidatus Aenigmarchaeota archaeon]|nr:hypothetical protein [Candidatus Aenigmarchaeota archaeon]